jgi:hypothetical protein
MLRSIIVAAGALLVVAATSFGLLATSFGRMPAGDRMLALAVRRLGRYSRATATIDANGRIERTTCVDHWRRRTSIARVRVGGRDVVEIGDHLEHATPVEETAFDLAGCPRPLRRWLDSGIALHRRVEARALEHPSGAHEVVLPRADPAIELVLSRNDVPIELEVRDDDGVGRSRVRYEAKA